MLSVVVLIFEDAIKEAQDICRAHRADHPVLKSLFNNMLLLPPEDKTLIIWFHFSSFYNGFVFRPSLWILWSPHRNQQDTLHKDELELAHPSGQGFRWKGTLLPHRGSRLQKNQYPRKFTLISMWILFKFSGVFFLRPIQFSLRGRIMYIDILLWENKIYFDYICIVLKDLEYHCSYTQIIQCE